MNHVQFAWRTYEGLQLYAQGWQPEGSVRGVVCLVHGLGEHSGRYAHVAAALVRAGYALLAFDLRGHGKSEGRRGWAAGFEVLLDDTSRLLDEATERFPGAARFLYGHSLGANLVLEYVLLRRPRLNGAIVTGPSLRTAFAPPAWKVLLGKALYRLWPALALSNEIDRSTLSRDPEVVRAYIDDPLVHDRLSVRLGIDLLSSGQWILEHATDLATPLLLMHGGDDGLTSATASGEFAAKAGDSCTLKIWDGLYHEIHNEPEQGQVFAYLLDWLRDRT